MRRMRKIIVAAALTAVPVVWLSAQELRGPSTEASNSASRSHAATDSHRSAATPAAPDFGPTVFPARKLPDQYTLLLRRSIFSKNHLTTDAEAERRYTRPPTFGPARESSLVFHGAMREGTRYLANIEDMGSHKITWVDEGQTLTTNGGQVVQITLDHIIVQKAGQRRLINVGETLDGGTPTAGSVAGPATFVGGRPSVTASTTGTASQDAGVEEMMRQRRLKELGQ